MISLEELKVWIFDNGMREDGKLVPRTEGRINKHPEIREAILHYTQGIKADSLCERMRYIGRGVTVQHTCRVCGKHISLDKEFCSTKCIARSPDTAEKRKRTNMDRYGVENPSKLSSVKEKISKSNKESALTAKEVRKVTNIERYGVEHLLQREDKKILAKQTTTIRHGVDNIFKSPEFKLQQQIRFLQIDPATKLERYTRASRLKFKTNFQNGLFRYSSTEIPLFTEDDWDLPITERKYLCLECNKEFYRYSANVTRCIHCYPIDMSRGESELYNFITSIYDGPVLQTDRSTIQPIELDIHIPEKQVAIEFNGLLFHSYGNATWSAVNNIEREDRNYHLEKTRRCAEQGIQLLHIFEDEWIDPIKQEIWKSMIRSKLGMSSRIYARRCAIQEIDYATKSKFLKENHLQGDVPSSHNLGLIYDGELIAVLTIGHSRFNKNYEWEILRYANKLNHSVLSGFTRLLSYFQKHNTGSVITYADMRYSNGNLYRSNGFVELKDSPPNYWYCEFRGIELHSRIDFQKHKLKDKLKIYDGELTESENMFNNQWRRIWDCGNKIFVLE